MDRETAALGIIIAVLLLVSGYLVFNVIQLERKISLMTAMTEIKEQIEGMDKWDLIAEVLTNERIYVTKYAVTNKEYDSRISIWFKNTYGETKNFTFSFYPNETLENFNYGNIILFYDETPYSLESGEVGVISVTPLPTPGAYEPLIAVQGQYLVKAYADGEEFAEGSFHVIATEHLVPQ